ncbi:aminopeptidase I zinc metalloprotease [Colletotrichum karsti]|uniref:Aminopeptidase I zinc metalloprotease n=1 Tax=Colletotrichum karsti TaxID=1095194 RepID=A0A9P6I2D8_9PEZI|nr:aminopeptidase I zinc metalloprotease [Colletotrichum karsti]KAF9874984.1 aminopeptidase I zinc metalloprotease [Colletotrichum karsti]
MTKHTPDSLRSRVSSLSLRLQAMEAAEALSRSQSPAPSMATSTTLPAVASKPFLLADMDGRPAASNPVCESCWNALRYSEVKQTTRASPSACKLCAVSAGKPEAYTQPFVDFLSENPTIFHAVSYFKSKLAAAGFTELPARDSWSDKLQPGGKYWTTRNGTGLIAFTVGEAYKPGNGVAMIAGHIDALTAKLKPVSTKPTRAGYHQLGVAPYAGALNQTWWDRDLSIGGRVIVRDDNNKTSSKLVRLDWPIARIPTLAPHFGVGMMGQNNPETQAVPIIGLENPDADAAAAAAAEPLGPKGAFINTQPPKLVKLVSKELGLSSPTQIVNWELELYDSQPAQTGGLDREFIFGGRIDDKLCSWAAFTALLAADSDPADGVIKLVALFDDEEIGSLLRQGARSNFLPLTIERAVESLTTHADSVPFGTDVLARTFASSFLLSADVTHAGNPNFLGLYLDDHVPKLNVGIAICGDSNGHMTTDAVSTAILQRVGELAGAPTQTFQIRNDTRSGGTVGPALSSAMGVKAADAGLPQLSMHSIRATTGALDPGLGVKFFKGFLDLWEKVDGEWH